MSYRIKVVIITLGDYPERIIAMKPLIKQLETIGLPVDIMYGVNGRRICVEDTIEPHIKNLYYGDQQLKYNRLIRANGQQMTHGEFGCAWSHHTVYEKLIADSDSDAYLVLEDDAELMCSIDYVREVIDNLPSEFDIIRTTPSIWYPFSKTEQINPYIYAYKKQYTNSTTSYIISKPGAQKMLTYLNGYLNVPSDDAYSNLFLYTEGVKSYASEQHLFKDPGTQPSIIHKMNSLS